MFFFHRLLNSRVSESTSCDLLIKAPRFWIDYGRMIARKKQFKLNDQAMGFIEVSTTFCRTPFRLGNTSVLT